LEEEEDPPAQRKLGTRGLLPSPGSFGGKTIGLNHHAIYLSDGDGADVYGGSGGRCGEVISFGTVGVGIASGCELGNFSHEEKRSGRCGLERTGRRRRREEAVHLQVDDGARVAEAD
jgi:hypothetical protein